MAHANVSGLKAEQGDAFDLERDDHHIQRWKHLASKRDQTNCSEMAWWMVVYKWVAVRSSPSLEGRIISGLARGDPLFCVAIEGAWVRVDLTKLPPEQGARQDDHYKQRLSSLGKKASEAYMMWDGQQKGFPVLLQPLPLLDRMLAYRHSEVQLPRDAVFWTVSEVDIYLGSLGFIRPGRESALMRSSKRLVRAVRGGFQPLEYRVDQEGKESGVFCSRDIAKGALVELCPLHEVPARLRDRSAVLQRLTVPMRCDQSRCAIVLGFGKVYTASQTPNLRWSYRGDDEVVLWAAEEILNGRELTVDFQEPPAPLADAKSPPATWQPPPQKPGKLEQSGFILHGESSIHGRGVFTTKDLEAGQLLESCPAVVMDAGAAEAMPSRPGL